MGATAITAITTGAVTVHSDKKYRSRACRGLSALLCWPFVCFPALSV